MVIVSRSEGAGGELEQKHRGRVATFTFGVADTAVTQSRSGAEIELHSAKQARRWKGSGLWWESARKEVHVKTRKEGR